MTWIPDWITACVAVAALIAAVWATVTSRALLKVERERDEERRRLDSASQASLLSAWAVFCPNVEKSEDHGQSGVAVTNHSNAAFYDVRIECQGQQGKPQPPIELTILPSGTYVMLGHPKFHWTFPLQPDEVAGPIRPITKHEKWRVTSIEMTDANGLRWRRTGGVLERLTDAA